MPPFLSVIVPVRDGGAAFRACLDGLARSLDRDFELIVVDDRCRDGSAAVEPPEGRGTG